MDDYILSGAIPAGDLSGLSILDVGSADGWRFDLPEFAKAKRLIGVDPNTEAIETGKAKRPAVEFHCAIAERLPIAPTEIDLYMSIVSLPYTDIPAALKEAHRVLKPGGRMHITMHDLPMQIGWLWAAVKKLSVKRVVDHAYIAAHSAWFAMTGRCFARPWRRDRFESFQTRSRMHALVSAAGFHDVRIRRTHRHFVIEAAKP